MPALTKRGTHTNEQIIQKFNIFGLDKLNKITHFWCKCSKLSLCLCSIVCVCVCVCVCGEEFVTPRAILAGHDCEVTCASVCAELGLVISGCAGVCVYVCECLRVHI